MLVEFSILEEIHFLKSWIYELLFAVLKTIMSCHRHKLQIKKDILRLVTRVEQRQKILSPHEESNLRPSDSALRCSTTSDLDQFSLDVRRSFAQPDKKTFVAIRIYSNVSKQRPGTRRNRL